MNKKEEIHKRSEEEKIRETKIYDEEEARRILGI